MDKNATAVGQENDERYQFANRDLLIPYVAPYFAYVFIASFLGPRISAEISYAIKLLVVPAIMVWAWRWYLPLAGPRNPFVSAATGIAVGVVGFVIWVVLLTPFVDPAAGNNGSDKAFYLRLISASLVVPVFEELFIRGYTFRVALQWDQLRQAKMERPFEKAFDHSCINSVAPGIWSFWSVVIATVIFALGHHRDEWLAAFAYGLLMTAVLIIRKDMLSCIVAHGTTNFVLALYVKMTGQYGLW